MTSYMKLFVAIYVCYLLVPLSIIAQDTEAPTIAYVDIASTNVSIRTSQIVVTLRENVIEPTDGFTITVAPSVSVSPNFSPSTANSLQIVIDDLLLFNTVYTFTIANVEDMAGNSANLTFTFKTGLPASVAVETTSNICIGDPTGKRITDIVITENLADNFINLETTNNIS